MVRQRSTDGREFGEHTVYLNRGTSYCISAIRDTICISAGAWRLAGMADRRVAWHSGSQPGYSAPMEHWIPASDTPFTLRACLKRV